MSNDDMQKLFAMLSKMDKKDLDKNIAKANEILKSKSEIEILNELKKRL